MDLTDRLDPLDGKIPPPSRAMPLAWGLLALLAVAAGTITAVWLSSKAEERRSSKAEQGGANQQLRKGPRSEDMQHLPLDEVCDDTNMGGKAAAGDEEVDDDKAADKAAKKKRKTEKEAGNDEKEQLTAKSSDEKVDA